MRQNDNVPPGSRWAIRALPESRDEWFARRLSYGVGRPLFKAAPDLFVALDCFLTGAYGDEALQFVLQFPGGRFRKNFLNPPLGTWTTVRAAVGSFAGVGGKSLPDGAAIEEVKIYAGPADAAVELIVDNLRFETGGREGFFPIAASPKAGEAGKEKVLLHYDFEKHAAGWSGGARYSGNTPPASEWAFRANSDSGDNWFARKIELSVYAIPRSDHPLPNTLFLTAKNQYFELDYFVAVSPAAARDVELCFALDVLGMKPTALCRYTIRPLTGEWTRVSVPIERFRVLGGPFASLGNRVDYTFVWLNADDAEAQLIIDNFRIVEKPEPD